MKSLTCWTSLLVPSFAAVIVAGCGSGDRRSPAIELDAVPGLSIVEYDGLDLRIKCSPHGRQGLALVVNGAAVHEAALRVGDKFTFVTDPYHSITYQVLLASEERIALKRRKVTDRRAFGDPLRTTEDVVAVKPYNLEDSE